MLIAELEMKLISYLKHTRFHIETGTRDINGTLSIEKSTEISKGIIEVLKDAAGEPYKDGETEEITFGKGGGYFLALSNE